MNILWDEEKNEKLKRERGISFEEIAIMILEKKYVRVVKHPRRRGQRIFLVPIGGYIHAVPFVFDDERNVILKTVFPSRKFNKQYGGKKQ
ncbi:MAG: BrnT family toxin [Ignavibacteriales bacterium]|nr:BrnT family toxin [Ignavibacteriales bacterium]